MLKGVPPSADQLRELEILIRAHHPMLLVDTVEDDRLHVLLEHAAEHTGLPLFSWTQVGGLRRELPEPGQTPDSHSPQKALAFIERSNLEAIFHLRGLEPYLHEPGVIALLRSIHRKYFGHRGAVVVSGHGLETPPALDHLFTPMNLEAPTPEAYHSFLQGVLRDLAARQQVKVQLSSMDVSQLLGALHGLTFFEVQKIITQAVVEDGVLGREDITRVLQAKRQIIERSGVLEYFPHEHQMGDIAGLHNLKDWLRKRQAAFVDPRRAKEYGLSPPKGLLLIGVQGCGKSLCAKAVASEWQLPLIRLDPSNLYNRYVGETEKNLRRAIKLAEQMAPVVLWIDEIEKSLSQEDAEGGPAQRIFGTFLAWLQDKKESVFVIATANDISKLPPELMRKGRFDEIFFVDLPGPEARQRIWQIHLERRKRNPAKFDVARLASLTEGFSGAEIEQAVVSALYTAFSREEELSTEALVEEIELTKPLSVTMAERITALREWAKDRAVFAG
ncbi:MAG TPA: AAA family ATPase [Polyangiales bacterium]|nr:AAA family ATPase [Polyangiales bacterium]